MAEDTGFSRLPRGAKILWECVGESRTLSLGFFFATGSRFDPPGKAGTAHLVEHLVFKGTRNHSASSLARLVDRVGGDLNAWTDREELAFTCTVPAEAWATAVEALTELCLFPTFPADEFDREKEVIRNEILSSLEDPEELSYDAFLAGTSPGDWSRPVAGTEESLEAISLDDVKAWWTTYGKPSGLTVVFSGGTEPEVVRSAVDRALEGLPPSVDRPRGAGASYLPCVRRWTEKGAFQMAQVIVGLDFPPPATPRTAAVWQIFSMLWGETMSSRLFQSVRERQGLCYSISSQVFEADGRWGLQVFVSCAPENTAPVLETLASELEALTADPPSSQEWEDARSALRGGIILGSERTEGRTGRLWRQFETFGAVLGTAETLLLVDQPVSGEESSAVLKALTGQKPSLLVWGKPPRRLPPPWAG